MPAAIMDKASSSDTGTFASPSMIPPAAALMAELVESSRNLPNSSSSLGSIRLGLSEIRKRAFELRKKLPVDNNTKA